MIGENIRYLRKMKGYSQEQLARKLKIKQASISLWESGKTNPETRFLSDLASIFDVPVDFFFSEEPRRDLDSISIRRAAIPVRCPTPSCSDKKL